MGLANQGTSSRPGLESGVEAVELDGEYAEKVGTICAGGDGELMMSVITLVSDLQLTA